MSLYSNRFKMICKCSDCVIPDFVFMAFPGWFIENFDGIGSTRRDEVVTSLAEIIL